MRVLIDNKKTEVCEEANLGWGVRATADISKGEIIQECPFVLMPRYTGLGKNLYEMLDQTGFLSDQEKYLDNLRANLGFLPPEAYFFRWNPDIPLNGKTHSFCVLPSGHSFLFNSSNTENNIGWVIKNKVFVFKAERDIKQGEYLRSFFGYFLGEEGQIFPCINVFGMGLDHFENNHVYCKAIRYGTMEEYESAKTNPTIHKISQIFLTSKNGGFIIKKITAMTANGEEKAAIDLNESMSISFIYTKITEFKNSQFPLIKFTISYKNQEGVDQTETIILKK